jgi:glycosyltransferase involved in cell wall biosynthesis
MIVKPTEIKMELEEGGVEAYSKDPKICFLSNYPPKECGIATFTRDLVNWMNKRFNPKLKSRVIALNDPATHYNYDKRVIHQMDRFSPEQYRDMAKLINESPDYRLVCIEHEFGMFGGSYGENILHFLDEIEKPVVITFHSVLSNPNDERKMVVREIAAKTAGIIVMAEAAMEILNKEYGIEKSKISVIHHGIPNAKFISSEQYKKKLGLEDKRVILTFGLLSRGKGIEHMIKALPPLVKKYPDLLYLILGETHPNVRREEGESYRNELMDLVRELDLEKNVKFQNKYVTTKELVEYILACDIYAFTNLEKAQITSGTLAYAMGCGRPVVATPVMYAEELLSQDRGVVIKEFMNPSMFTNAINSLLSDPEMMKNMAEAAYAFGRKMTWSNVAAEHLRAFNRIVRLREEITKKYPSIKLEHLKKLTDKFGCIQFAKGSIPDKSTGYTVDDNARALITSVLHNLLTKSRKSLNMAKTYLNFLENAQEKNGNFRNNFKNSNVISEAYSDDAIGRAIWALGYVIRKSKNQKISEKAEHIFNKAKRKIEGLGSLRAKAYILTGLYHHYKKFGEEADVTKIKKLANSILEAYEKSSSENWHWFEDKLTYDNARIAESLFLAYEITLNERYLEVGERTINFLSDIVFENDELMPIGQNGWFDKEGKRAMFDQQPIDASSMVLAYITAYRVTKNRHYYEKAVLAFNWFLGRNHLKQMLYDEATGGCFDGLGKHAVNLNQGAESTISYLMARLMLEEIKTQSQDV